MSNGRAGALAESQSIAWDEPDIREFARRNRMSEQRARDVLEHCKLALSSAAPPETPHRSGAMSIFARALPRVQIRPARRSKEAA